MSGDDDKIVSLEERRRAKVAADKVIQKQQQRLKRGPKKKSFNAGYLFIMAVIIAALGLNYLRAQPSDNVLTFQVLGDTAIGNGSTDSTSLNYVTRFLNQNPQISHLVFQNMPGTSDGATNLKIAELIRKRGISTHIQSDSYIASGAVDLFIAGTRRTMDCGAQIGVHGWRSAPGIDAESLGRDPLKQSHEKFLSDMGVDPAFYSFTQEAAPPQDIYVLKIDEIARFGLLTIPVNCD